MPFPKRTVLFGGSNVPFESVPKPTMCPLAPPQNQHIFNSHLNYLNLKTVWVQTTELSEHRKMLYWQWYTCNKCLVLTITTFKMRGVVIDIICALWPINSGENTAANQLAHASANLPDTRTIWYARCTKPPCICICGVSLLQAQTETKGTFPFLVVVTS